MVHGHVEEDACVRAKQNLTYPIYCNPQLSSAECNDKKIRTFPDTATQCEREK
jgi:hypothetical protein